MRNPRLAPSPASNTKRVPRGEDDQDNAGLVTRRLKRSRINKLPEPVKLGLKPETNSGRTPR